ncbi:flagellar basal-body rod protein FlgG [Chitinivorax tropicus]|uniref:Flagellar basal-body rod protein FlgG n=1 Tax=Chitinivorax tropicus TaxID=714531 RepID=A0A840MK17_9PROT|nr:flagellar basal-body rod protein FlgG [Chitinivorax tropicus]MBB5018740.1 flagellar basal-body rod protein FlgG [Chitinivorax tropicus]
MIRALWVAKTGMDAQQTHIDVISHNLANVNTTGYKRQRAVFEDLIYQTLRQPGALATQTNEIPTGLQLGVGARVVATARTHTEGTLQKTDNPFDIAINGRGFFQIQLPDGTTAYTRDGSFELNSQGQMVTSSGYLLQPNITLPANAQSVTVGLDGIVTVVQPGNVTPVQIGQIQLADFINPAGLQSRGENLYLETGSSGAPQVNTPGLNGTGILLHTYVENSNVNVTEELINMIQAQRAFEINSRAIQASDQMLQKLTQL